MSSGAEAATILPARSDADIAAVTQLAWEFVAFLRDRYPERDQQITEYLAEQRFEEMLADFRHWFNPPAGECFLARVGGEPAGIVMLKPQRGDTCEMNRMFVRPAARGLGVGRALCVALLTEARRLGYRQVKLGALNRHHEAIPLYRSLGFEDDPEPPAYASPNDGAIYMRLVLTTDRGGDKASAQGVS